MPGKAQSSQMKACYKSSLILLLLLAPGLSNAQERTVEMISAGQVKLSQLPPSLISSIKSRNSVENVQSDIQHWLADEGYLDAAVDSIRLDQNSVEIFVNEGCKYTLESFEISVDRDTASVEIPAFQPRSSYKGQVFSDQLIREISSDWLTYYEDLGFYLSEFKIESVVKNESRCTIDLQATIQTGKITRAEGVRFTGVSRNSADYLRRVSGIRAGERVTPGLIDRGRLNLINSGLFEEVSDGELILVDSNPFVLYEVTEQQLNFFDGLIGYQPDAGGSGNIAGYGDILLRNTIADGNVLDLRYEQLQPLVSKLNITAEQHFVGGLPLHFGAGVHFTQQDSSYLVRDFNLNGGYRLFPGLELIGSVRAERSSVAEFGIAREAIDSQANFYGLGFHLRNTNRYRVPTKGFESRVMLERGRRFINEERFRTETGGSFSQTILRSMVRGYIPIGNRQVLAPRLQAMFLESPHYLITDLFRFGGAESFRGFREDQFRGSSVIWGELEGRYMLERNSYLFLFGAYGLYDRPQLLNEETDVLSVSERLTSAGFGLAFQSPLGIIKFSYAVSPSEDLANGNVHVGITTGL